MTAESSPTIAFIGGGNMARALIAGLLRHGTPAERLRVGEPEAATGAALARDFGIEVRGDNAQALGDAELVVLAVKPQQALRVVRSLAEPLSRHRPVLLSIAAGIRLGDLSQAAPAGVPLVRAMPNRPALLGAGVTALYAEPAVELRSRTLAERVAAAAGQALWVRSERELDVVTALSGSGPAYFFLLAEHLASAGEALGLERETASALARETLHGAGLLAHAHPDLAEQRAAVTSRGGTTEAALSALQQGGFEALVMRAVRAAASRAAELAAAGGTAPQAPASSST